MKIRFSYVVAAAIATASFGCGDPAGNNDDNNSSNNSTTGSNNMSTGTNNTSMTNTASNGSTNGMTNSSTNSGTNSGTNNTTNNTNGPTIDALAVTADFAEGMSAWHAVSFGGAAVDVTTTDFGSGDLGVSVGEQWAYVLDRNSSQVQVLDPADDLADAGVIDVSGVQSTNPQFAADANGKVYVPLYNVAEVVVATPNGQDWDVERLNTAPFDSYDSNPEASNILADDGFVLVALQTLQDFSPVENSQLLVIDTSDDTFVDFDDQTGGVQPLDLGVTNAQAGLQLTASGDIAVGHTGAYGTADGGITILERNAAGDYTVGDTIVSETDLGGDLLDFVMLDDTSGYAVVNLADFSTKIVEFEIGQNSVAVTDVTSVEGPGFAGLDSTADAMWLAVGSRTDSPSFNLVDTTTNEVSESFSTTLPPAGIEFLD